MALKILSLSIPLKSNRSDVATEATLKYVDILKNFVVILCKLGNILQIFFVYFCHGWKQKWQSFENQKYGWLKYYEKLKSLLC